VKSFKKQGVNSVVLLISYKKKYCIDFLGILLVRQFCK